MVKEEGVRASQVARGGVSLGEAEGVVQVLQQPAEVFGRDVLHAHVVTSDAARSCQVGAASGHESVPRVLEAPGGASTPSAAALYLRAAEHLEAFEKECEAAGLRWCSGSFGGLSRAAFDALPGEAREVKGHEGTWVKVYRGQHFFTTEPPAPVVPEGFLARRFQAVV